MTTKRRTVDPLSRDPAMIEKTYQLSRKTRVMLGRVKYILSAREIADKLSRVRKRPVTIHQVTVLWHSYGQGREGFVQEVKRRKKNREPLLLLTHTERQKQHSLVTPFAMQKSSAKEQSHTAISNDLEDALWLRVADSLMRKGGSMNFAIRDRALPFTDKELRQLIIKKYQTMERFFSQWGAKVHEERRRLRLDYIPNLNDGTG